MVHNHNVNQRKRKHKQCHVLSPLYPEVSRIREKNCHGCLFGVKGCRESGPVWRPKIHVYRSKMFVLVVFDTDSISPVTGDMPHRPVRCKRTSITRRAGRNSRAWQAEVWLSRMNWSTRPALHGTVTLPAYSKVREESPRGSPSATGIVPWVKSSNTRRNLL